MLKSLIVKLRHKPKAIRDNLALLVAAIFTGGIFAVWFFTVPLQMQGGPTETQDANIFSGLSKQIREEVGALSFDLPEPAATTTDTSETDTATSGASVTTATSSQAENPTAVASSTTSGRSIRIATTSASSSDQ